ncbi:hypothetical protein KAR48_20015 [bacterium]|nr:hypothetical protein [bacterium]
MRQRFLFILLTCLFVSQAMGQDIITKKDGLVIRGRVVKRANKAIAIRTTEGILTVVKQADVSSIQRGKMLYDLETQIRYRIEKRRPYLPFLILTGAGAAYAVKQFDEYKKNKKEADAEIRVDDIQNLNDKSKRNLATSIVSGIISIGTAYIALRPIEVKTPLGPFKMSLGIHDTQIRLSMNF